MYNYKSKDIIQDIERLSAWDNFIQKIQKVFKNTKQSCVNLKERYDTWYRTYDFELAGHKTAWFIKYKLFPFVLWVLLLSMIVFTLSYVVIQFEFATGLRPEFIDTWINGLDKSKLPLLFQEKQGHPILLFVIWCMMFKCFFIFFRNIPEMFERNYGALIYDIPSFIQTFVVICLINSHYIYWVVGIYLLYWISQIFKDAPERHGFNVYDKDGNHIGSFERF